MFVLRYLGLLMKTGNRSSASQAIELQMNEYASKFSLPDKEQLTAEYSRLSRPEFLGTFSTASVLDDGTIVIKLEEIV